MPRATSVVAAALGPVLLAASLVGCADRTTSSPPPSPSTQPSSTPTATGPTESPALADVCLLTGSPTPVEGALEASGLRVRSAPRLAALVDTPCALLLSVSASDADTMVRAAVDHPDLPVAAAGVRVDGGSVPANLARLGTDLSGAAFVAGYAAAAASGGSVGVLSLGDDPAGPSAASAFAAGVRHRSSQDGRAVALRGAAPVRVVADAAEAERVVGRWADRGVDVVLLASPGLADVAAPPDVRLVRVGTPRADAGLGWIVPDLSVPARAVAQAVADGTFAGAEVEGSLADGGVRLDLGAVSADLRAQADALAEQVASGRMAVGAGG